MKTTVYTNMRLLSDASIKKYIPTEEFKSLLLMLTKFQLLRIHMVILLTETLVLAKKLSKG